MEEADRKRKRPAGGWVDRTITRNARRDAGNPRGGAVAEEAAPPPVDGDVEEEVEEFFAIVRRMQAATRQFAGGGERMTETSGRQMPRRERAVSKGIYRWRPAFEWEDFEEEGRSHKRPDAGDGYCTGREVGSATSAPLAAVGLEEKTAVCFDLNTEPEPEPERVVG